MSEVDALGVILTQLSADIQSDDNFPVKRPLLAHYTSISTLESVLMNDELWFSNPLYMNDLEELRFGMVESTSAFRRNEMIRRACGSDERYMLLLNEYDRLYNEFDYEHAFDTYVFCMSEHGEKEKDGLLSMWRGYGGNGNGAAIIFDLEKINYKEDSPLIISKVSYATGEERIGWIRNKLNEFSSLLVDLNPNDDELLVAARILFERFKIFSLFTKHQGFSEEREWRVVYLRERDNEGVFEDMLGYSLGRSGIELKFKLKIEPISGVTDNDLSMEKIISQIILGPTVSNPLALRSVKRMLGMIGKNALGDRVHASSTPYRA